MKQITFYLLNFLYFSLIYPYNAQQIVHKDKENQEHLQAQETKRGVITNPVEPNSVEEVMKDAIVEKVDAGIAPEYSTQQPLTKERKQLLLTFFASIKNKFTNQGH